MGRALFLLLVFVPFAAFSQAIVTGKAVNQADGKPVAGAVVFLSNTGISSKTAGNGTFSLKNIKPGNYNLIITGTGFVPYNQTVNLSSGSINLQPVTISPKSIASSQVAEKAGETSTKYLALFKSEFLGSTPQAKECRIDNPAVLNLRYDERSSTLTASTDDFLMVVNNALGYKIRYIIKDFTMNNSDERTVNYTGFALFEKLKGTAAQEQEWRQHRQEAYEGSQAHFLNAAVEDKLDQQGFKVLRLPINPDRPADSLINAKLKVYLASAAENKDSLNYWVKKKRLSKTLEKLDPTTLTKQDLIAGPDEKGLYALSAKNAELYINYNKYHRVTMVPVKKISDPANTDNTLVTFNVPQALFDKNDVLVNPQNLSYEGAWTRVRVAALLPTDFEPQHTAAIAPDSLLVKNLTAKLNTHGVTNTEKAYLHFDKPYYVTGDTIYFKAYVTDAIKHELSKQSEVLNVELINSENKVSRWEKIQLTNGLGWGDFALPDTLDAGNYHIRAYTNLMRNAGSDYFFDKNMVIGSTTAAKIPESGGGAANNSSVIAGAPGKPNVQFLPEGGNILAGVKTKIAFKAIAPDGLSANVKGTVTDNENKTVATFATTHFGMGEFELTPAAGKTYKANVIYADGTTGTVDLPKASDDGYQLNIDHSNPVAININVSGGRQSPLDKVSLVGQSGGVIYFSAKNTDSKQFNITVSKSEFPTGIVQFTLFSSDGLPLNERLVFVNNNDQLKLDVSAPQTAYATRKKVMITIDAKNKANQPAVGNFSVAVTDESKVPASELNDNTILSNLLLTSDLGGYIEKPNYYFTNISEKTNAGLDLLMLTQGYHRFEWKPLLADNTTAQAYQPEKALTLAGIVKKGGKPLANQKVTLFAKTGGNFFKDTLTDGAGKFVFKNLVFGDSTKFVVQAKVSKGQDNVELRIDTPVVAPVTDLKNGRSGGIKLSNNNTAEIDMSAYIQNSKQYTMELQKYGINQHPLLLKEVDINDKKGPDKFENSQNFNGKGSADQTVTAKDLETLACGRLMECLRAKLINIVFRNGYMYVRKLGGTDFTSGDEFKNPMKIMIDGTMQEAGYDLLDNINTGDVESVEVLDNLHSTAIYGTQGSAGLILVTLKRGRKLNNYYRYAPGVVTYAPKGFYLARTFYAPQYDTPKTNEKMADLRSTIYWNPTVVTELNGKATFGFFNADGKGTYRVIVEGIDAEGNLGRQVYRYTVD